LTWVQIPDNTSFDDAATFPVAFPAACVLLFPSAPLGLGLNPTFSWDKPQQGESALLIGGSTSVGQFGTNSLSLERYKVLTVVAIQLLKFVGFTRIIAYASKANFEYLRQLGATECIDRTEVPIDSLAAHITPPVKLVYDTIGELNAAYDSAMDGGSVVTVHPMANWTREGKNLTLVRAQARALPEHTAFRKLLKKILPEMLEKGALVVCGSNSISTTKNSRILAEPGRIATQWAC
jgi:NADPH:quinone reductase-like Zn-dependent oxidoreductase